MPGFVQKLSCKHVILGTIVCSVAVDAAYLFVKWIRKRNADDRYLYEILFFPDAQPTCKAAYTNRHGCTAKYCNFSHNDTSFCKLMKHLASARRTLDLCVFVFTCSELRDMVLSLAEKGVTVRLITDKDQIHNASSAVGPARAKGILVRSNDTSYFMHHKFAVVDGHTLINGSFNWTRQAITGNHENLLITDNPTIVKPYTEQFQTLWTKFKPEHSLTES